MQRAFALDARELVAEAEMNPGAEGDVAVRLSREIELFRMSVGFRIEVCRRQHGHDFLARPDPDAAKLNLPPREARLGELHRRNEA